MSKLKIEYEIYGKRYDIIDEIYHWGGNKEFNGGELFDETSFNAKYSTILSYVNLKNQDLLNKLNTFAKQEVDQGKAVDNDFMVFLKISDVDTKKIHVDMAFNTKYYDGTLVPKTV